MSTKTPSQAISLSQPKMAARSAAESGWFFPLLSAMLTVADLTVAVGAFYLSLRYSVGNVPIVGPGSGIFGSSAPEFAPYVLLMLFIPLVRLAALHHFDLYRLRGEFSTTEDMIGVFLSTSLGSLVMIMLAFFYRGGDAGPNFSYPRDIFLYDWALALVGFSLLRIIVRAIQTIYRNRHGNMIPAVVVGNGDLAEICLEEITGRPRLGYNVVGVAVNDGETCKEVGGIPVLGSFSHLPAIIKQYGIEEVLITDSRINPKVIFDTIMRCGRGRHVDFRVLPDLFNCLPAKTEVQPLGTLPLIKLFEEPLEGFNRFFKRGVDLICTVLIIMVTAPVWLTVMLLLKLDSKGPLFYIQERVGMDGRPFGMYKFRSMFINTDDTKHREIMKAAILNQEQANQGDDDKPVFGKVKDDPRITRVGRLIRKYSIDELPQLINVIRGEMSLV